ADPRDWCAALQQSPARDLHSGRSVGAGADCQCAIDTVGAELSWDRPQRQRACQPRGHEHVLEACGCAIYVLQLEWNARRGWTESGGIPHTLEGPDCDEARRDLRNGKTWRL